MQKVYQPVPCLRVEVDRTEEPEIIIDRLVRARPRMPAQLLDGDERASHKRVRVAIGDERVCEVEPLDQEGGVDPCKVEVPSRDIGRRKQVHPHVAQPPVIELVPVIYGRDERDLVIRFQGADRSHDQVDGGLYEGEARPLAEELVRTKDGAGDLLYRMIRVVVDKVVDCRFAPARHEVVDLGGVPAETGPPQKV